MRLSYRKKEVVDQIIYTSVNTSRKNKAQIN